MTTDSVYEFALRMGDNCLILGQRVSAWCGHAPVLEEDIALANTALDLIGQTKMWLSLAAQIDGKDRTADEVAFLRDSREFRNCLLVEQPNGNFGDTLMRQFLFDAWHHPMLKALQSSTDKRVSEIADKSVKEAAYHLDRSADLIVRLGDGSAESHDKMQEALTVLWPYTGELFNADSIDDDLAEKGVTPRLSDIEQQYLDYMDGLLRRATLKTPEGVFMKRGGKQGLHTEDFGYLLAEMQSLQRAHPGATW